MSSPRIESLVQRAIEHLKAQNRNCTTRDIGKLAGVSKATVARSAAYKAYRDEVGELAQFDARRGRIPPSRLARADVANAANTRFPDPADDAAERERPRPSAAWTDADWWRYVITWVVRTEDERADLLAASDERKRWIVGLARLQWRADRSRAA